MTFQNDALLIMAEVISCKIFFETFVSKKKDKPFYTSYMILVCLALSKYALSQWLAEHFVLKVYMIILVTAVFMFAYLDLALMAALILSFLFQCLIWVIDYAGVTFVLYFLADRESLIKPYLPLASIFCKLCSFFIIIVINRIFKKRTKDTLQIADTLKFAIFPIFSLVMVSAIIAAYQYVEKPQQADILIVIAIGQLGMNIFIYYLLSNLIKRERKIRDEKIYMLEVRNQTTMYQVISENYNAQRKKVHEFKNQILCIEGLLHQKKYDKAEEYVIGISGNLSQETNAIDTNHAIINAILNTKYKEAEQKQIVFVVKVNDLSTIWMEDADIVVILSNLLDNAVEAVEKCEQNRVIKLKFVIEDDIIISVKNTYAQKPQIINGAFVTSKLEKEAHGIGMQNIVDTVKKYNGSYVVKDEANEFLFSILIPNLIGNSKDASFDDCAKSR